LRRFIVIVLSLILAVETWAQCEKLAPNYTEGEVIKYDVYYNWGFLWFDAGWVNFSVKPGKYFGKDIFYFDAIGQTRESYDWIYKVRDHYESYIDKETLLPLWSRRQNFEGGTEVDHKYTFDWNKKLAFASLRSSDKPFYTDSIKLQDCTYDLLSLIYHARNLDFTGVTVGQAIPVSTIIEDKVYNLYIRYLGKEVITDKMDRTYRCIKFSALLVEGTIFSGGENMTVWVTDDKAHVPVIVAANIVVGSVKAYLNTASGLKYPITAKVSNPNK
jgi:hypothetical protein